MFFVCICYLLIYTAKTKSHGILALTSAKRFTYINRKEPGDFQKLMYVFTFAQPLLPATGKCLQAPSLPVQKDNNQTDSYHI